MILIRITDPFELIAVKDKVYPLFERYYEKAKHYLENLESPEIAWENCVTKSIYPDYYLYLIRENDEFVGFFAGCLLRMPRFLILYTYDYYAPNKGIRFSETLKQIKDVLGVDEIWGEAPDKVINGYKRLIREASVKKVQMVRVRL